MRDQQKGKRRSLAAPLLVTLAHISYALDCPACHRDTAAPNRWYALPSFPLLPHLCAALRSDARRYTAVQSVAILCCPSNPMRSEASLCFASPSCPCVPKQRNTMLCFAFRPDHPTASLRRVFLCSPATPNHRTAYRCAPKRCQPLPCCRCRPMHCAPLQGNPVPCSAANPLHCHACLCRTSCLTNALLSFAAPTIPTLPRRCGPGRCCALQSNALLPLQTRASLCQPPRCCPSSAPLYYPSRTVPADPVLTSPFQCPALHFTAMPCCQ